MADETLETLEQESLREGAERNNIKERFTKLSQKIDEEAKARAAEAEARKKAEAEAQSAARERDFYKNFNTLITRYPGSADFQDKIREKVLSGYDVEDATIAILAKEGKLPSKPVEKEVVAGGSAANLPNTGAQKTYGDMSQQERREKLKEIIG